MLPVARLFFKRCSLPVLAICLMAACGGGGGDKSSGSGGASGGTGGSNEVSALTLTASTPANGTANVDRNISPELLFSTGLDAATVNTSNIRLEHSGGSAALSFAVAGDGATLTPSRRLLRDTTYTLKIGTGVKGSNGARLAGERTVTFTTAGISWDTPQLIETNNAGDAFGPQIAFDPAGNATAVWYQWDGARLSIYANRYTAGSGWGAAQLLETDNSWDATDPQVAMDAAGNAIAVWQQRVGSSQDIYANRYTVGSGWGTATKIQTSATGGGNAPQIAVDSAGNAIVVWSRDSDVIYASRYTAATGTWGADAPIATDTTPGYDAFYPQIAFDSAGNGMAVWIQNDGTGTNLNAWARRYTAGAWGPAQIIDTASIGWATSPKIAFDAAGNAMAVWLKDDGTRYNVWANRYAAGTWGTATQIDNDSSGNAAAQQIAFDAAGNAMAVWSQAEGAVRNVYAKPYVAGSGWGATALLQADPASDAIAVQVAFDPTGNAIAVWMQKDGSRFDVWTRRYTAGGSWGTAELLETDNAGDARAPQIAFDAQGNAMAVWQQKDGSRYNITARRFD